MYFVATRLYVEGPDVEVLGVFPSRAEAALAIRKQIRADKERLDDGEDLRNHDEAWANGGLTQLKISAVE